MVSHRHVLSLSTLVILSFLATLSAPATVTAQGLIPVPLGGGSTPGQEPAATTTEFQLSYQEVYRLLLDRGLSEEAVTRILSDYTVDQTFSENDINELFRKVSPSDYQTRKGREERAPEEEVPLTTPQTTGGGAGEPTPFGYDIFRLSPTSFEPDQDLAVGSDYRLGPGDELRIAIWGSVQQEYFAEVNREGNVTLPEIGVFPAAGLTLIDFEQKLTAEVKRSVSSFKLSVSLRRLRRIQVIVAGAVVKPGAYFLSPVSTTFNALYFAGGPTPAGTLRMVRVVRDGKILATVDLYQYLLEGSTSGDVRLNSGDTVFILPRGGTATIRGEVNRPAIFEIVPGERISQLVRMAGGLKPTSYLNRVTLDRITPGVGPETRDLDLLSLSAREDAPPAEDPSLQDGDYLTVYSIYHVQPRQFVEVQGMVQYPGIYPLFPGMRVSDVVFRAGGLLDSAFKLRADLSRIALWNDNPELKKGVVSEVLPVDLATAVGSPAGDEDIVLSKDDKLYIRKIPGWKTQETVKVAGEVVFPGIYPLLVREERLSSVIQRSGGLTSESFLKGASLFRGEEGRVIINFEKALKDPGNREDIVLVDGDSINVPAYPPTILVEGQVSRPGALLYQPGKNADYYVERTGGPNDNADRGGARIVRVDGVVQKAFRKFWWDPKVSPGSRIVVSQKSDEKGINWGTTIKDATTILASLATTVFIVTQINKN